MKKISLLLLFMMIFSDFAYSQFASGRVLRREINRVVKVYEDSLIIIRDKYFPIEDSLKTEYLFNENKELDPRFFKLFVPLTYYHAPVHESFHTEWRPAELKEISSYPVEELFPVDYSAMNQTAQINKRVNRALLDAYIQYPEKVVTTEDRIRKRKRFQNKAIPEQPPKKNIIDLFRPDSSEKVVAVDAVDVDFVIRKPNFWVTGGSGSLQFTQSYISSNWHKGGESTNSLLSFVELDANYNDKNRIEFDNKLLVRIGFITAPSDTVHSYKANDDVLRLTSKLGIKAITNWYYTISAEFSTQFFSNYETNSNDKKSGFMSPGNFYLGIGMDYKINKEKFNLSVVLSPITYNLKYVTSDDVDPTKHGIKEGKTKINDFGSRIQPTMKWTIIPSIVWESRFDYFTNYKKVEAEWENTINFVLNRYLSTKLFVHARFDDNGSKSKKDSYFQLKELLSFGLNYNW